MTAGDSAAFGVIKRNRDPSGETANDGVKSSRLSVAYTGALKRRRWLKASPALTETLIMVRPDKKKSSLLSERHRGEPPAPSVIDLETPLLSRRTYTCRRPW